MANYLSQLSDLYEKYDVFFCDVWGVLHNGVNAYSSAVRALERARRGEKCVFLITNSPHLGTEVARQLAVFGISSSCYDGIITAGDLARDLIKTLPKEIFYIGPSLSKYLLYNELDVVSVAESDALAVVCTGLFDGYSKLPENYRLLLQRLQARNLPFVCTNPDEKICYGKETVWCAGSLARIYKELGGNVLISGKPHSSIYDFACKMAGRAKKEPLDLSRVLAIGDSFMTDIRGAFFYGIDTLFIAGGVHSKEYMDKNTINIERFELFLVMHTENPTFCMLELC